MYRKERLQKWNVSCKRKKEMRKVSEEVSEEVSKENGFVLSK